MEYRVLKKLSEGGFSEVFEVRDPASALEERLVLKRLHPSMSARPKVRRAFTDEARILRELRHPYVVTFRRCYSDQQGRICLVMDWIEGQDLATWAKGRAGDPRGVLRVFGQVLEAVDYLHHRPVPLLHLDLKPENILVRGDREDSHPVLIDFGIARRFGSEGLRAHTPPYAAPEQGGGASVGCYSDVYALGRILLELLELLGPALSESARTEMEAVARRASAPSRRQRYADAGDFIAAFSTARGTLMPSVSGYEPPLPGSRLRIGVLSGLLLGAGAIGLVSLLSPDEAAVLPQRQPGSELWSQQRFDALLDQGYASRDFGTIQQKYLAASELLENRSLDQETRIQAERKLAKYRLWVESRQNSAGRPSQKTAH